MTSDFIAQFGDIAKPWNQLMSSTTAQSDPEAHDHVRARPGGRCGAPGVGRVRRHAGEDRLRRHRPLHLGQLDVAGAGPRGGRLHGGPEGPPAGRVLQRTAGIYGGANYDISSTYWSADYPDAQDYFSTNFICGTIDILNISHFCDEAIDAALFATEAMPFGPERDAALLDVQQRLIDEVAGVPVMEVTPQVVYGPAGRRHAHAGDLRAVRLEARLGQGRGLRALGPAWPERT